MISRAPRQLPGSDFNLVRVTGVITGSPAGLYLVLGTTDPDDPNKARMITYIKGAQSLGNFKRAIEKLLKPAD